MDPNNSDMVEVNCIYCTVQPAAHRNSGTIPVDMFACTLLFSLT